MTSADGVAAAMDRVEEKQLVRWNGRSNPQVVTRVGDTWFEVRSRQESRYRFYPHGKYLVNQQSETEYDVNEFEIVGEVYDSDVW